MNQSTHISVKKELVTRQWSVFELNNETKGGICLKIELIPQKYISLVQHGRRFFVYFSHMAALTSYEHTLFDPSTIC